MALFAWSCVATAARLPKKDAEVLDRLSEAYHGFAAIVDQRDASISHEFETRGNTFLQILECAFCAMSATRACRFYRASWTRNYVLMFQRGQLYNVHVLRASMDKSLHTVRVNGLKFEHSDETVNAATSLLNALSDFGKKLGDWRRLRDASGKQQVFSNLGAVRKELEVFDVAWVAFEKLYIAELIGIEQTAKDLLIKAIDQEKRVAALELKQCSRIKISSQEERLLEFLFQLHSATGLDQSRDLSATQISAPSILRTAAGILSTKDATSASRLIAAGVVESFSFMRDYLSKVGERMINVDANLRNNRGLVERLTIWGEAWEIGNCYLEPQGVLRSLDEMVVQLREICDFSPAFANMCETQDAELFLVLPRLVWLNFLSEPNTYTPLLRSLVPHRFHQDSLDPELKSLVNNFNGIMKHLDAHRVVDSITASPWKVLIAEAVGGDSSCCSLSPAASAVVHALVRDLEGFSMELQRHRASAWNELSSVLLRSCAAIDDVKLQVQFRV